MDKWLIYPGTKIFYRSIGTGKPIMLIHGFAEDGEIWKYQSAFLEDQYQLIIPDLPGSGQSPVFSPQPAGSSLSLTDSEALSKVETQPSMDDFAVCIKAILDAEN